MKVNKIKCYCGTDITTMKNCIKKDRNCTCKKCGKDITRKKFHQLIDSLKEIMK